MSTPFISDNFLLHNDAAVRLYHQFARDLPIIDYHCHLPPEQVARDHRFENLTQIWLCGDHYKWRAMRAAGVPERYCTGDASDWEKFEKWAATVPRTLRNPLYHWTHLELNRPFGINDRLLGPETAQGIWDQAGEMLARDDFSCRGIMKQMHVVVVCTTDDPCDSLEHHKAIAADPSLDVAVLPTFRPDKAMAVDNLAVFNPWVDRLARSADIDVGDYASFLEALRARHSHFDAVGGRLSDHGLDTFYDAYATESEMETIFRKARLGTPLPADDVQKFKMTMLYELALLDHEKGWTQQFHIGALRNNNTRSFQALGPDSGFDSMGDWPVAQPLARFLDRLDRENRLTRTILYNLNPTMNDVLATMIGNFQDGVTPGKMQFGSGWWFLDQKDGMQRQLEVLSNQGLLSLFVGMLTDSRSFLSYTRHEYFRRILCNLLGTEMEQGLLPGDFDLVGSMVQDISYHNAAGYFGFPLGQPG
ncbi:MAG: glucuronate isomerase [Thermoguttaceae bacterium]